MIPDVDGVDDAKADSCGGDDGIDHIEKDPLDDAHV